LIEVVEQEIDNMFLFRNSSRFKRGVYLNIHKWL
jgi:hypothetical protein